MNIIAHAAHTGRVSNCSSLDHNSRVITTDALLNAFHFFSQSSELIFTFALRNFFKFWKIEFNLVECSAKSIKYLEMYRLDVAPYSRITLCHFAVTRSRCERSYGCLTFMHTSLQPREAYIKLPDIFAFLHATFKWRHKSHVRHSRRAPRIFCLSSTSSLYGNIYGSVRRQMFKHISKRSK